MFEHADDSLKPVTSRILRDFDGTGQHVDGVSIELESVDVIASGGASERGKGEVPRSGSSLHVNSQFDNEGGRVAESGEHRAGDVKRSGLRGGRGNAKWGGVNRGHDG